MPLTRARRPVGTSIEDAPGDPGKPLYDFGA
jgi:hypothetical protein